MWQRFIIGFVTLIILVFIAEDFYQDYRLEILEKEVKVKDSLFLDMYYSIIDSNEKTTFTVIATTYNLSVYQCDSDYMTPASGFKFEKDKKYVSLSRDLLEEFAYGEVVYLENIGVYSGKYIVADCMNKRYARRVDILIPKNEKHFMFKTCIIRRLNN